MSDDLYKQMVLALPDNFFECWQWKVGDRALYQHENYLVEVVITSLPMDDRINAIFAPPSDGEQYLIKLCELRPLSSQKQLQDIIRKHPEKVKERFPSFPLKEITDGWILHVFNEYMEFLSPSIWSKATLEEYWLLLVMFVFYSEWDGEKWAEVK